MHCRMAEAPRPRNAQAFPDHLRQLQPWNRGGVRFGLDVPSLISQPRRLRHVGEATARFCSGSYACKRKGTRKKERRGACELQGQKKKKGKWIALNDGVRDGKMYDRTRPVTVRGRAARTGARYPVSRCFVYSRMSADPWNACLHLHSNWHFL